MDGMLVHADQLDTAGIGGAVVLVPARAAADFLLRLGGDRLLRARVRAVLVEDGAVCLPTGSDGSPADVVYSPPKCLVVSGFC